MSLLNEIREKSGGYTVINFGGKTVYIEAYKRLKSITSECIELEVRNATLEIVGMELILDEVNDGTLTVTGKILAITERGQ